MNNQISVRMICSQAARIDSQNRKQLTSALEAEGNKRLESFMFEKLFLERLGAALRPGAHTTGWGFVPDGDSNEPRLWYKLLPDGIEGQLNVCDLAVGNYLKSRNCRVIVARYDWARREFQGNLWGASGQRDWAALDTIMKEVSGKSTPVTTPRDYRDSDRLQRHAIADAIGGSFTDRELTNLVASRLLINCHMYPWMGIQPMDIDACYVFNGRVRFIEFKRKYPQIQRLQFGLDERPHCALVDWLALDGSPLTHIILCDPIWNKTVSPLNLLVPNSASAPHVLWLGANLGRASFESDKFATTGADSGMFGGYRQQRIIRSDEFRLIGQGMHPSNLADFLLGKGTLPKVTPNNLTSAHRAAVNRLG